MNEWDVLSCVRLPRCSRLSGTAALVVLIVMTAACGSEAIDPTTRPTAAPSGPTADATVHPTASSTSGTGLQTADNAGEWDLVFTDVEVTTAGGRDRVVLVLDGTGTPGWSVEYVDRPRLEGSGDPVDLAGDAALQVSASGTTWPDDHGRYYDGPSRIAPVGTALVEEVYVAGTFEGYTQVLVGIQGARAPFSVSTLADPPRLVVEIGA